MTLFGFFRSEMEVGFGGMGILNLITEISKYKYSRYLKKLALLRSAIEKLAFSFLMITYNISFINFKFLGIKLMFIPKKYKYVIIIFNSYSYILLLLVPLHYSYTHVYFPVI